MTTETKKPVTAPTWDKKEKDAIAEYGCELLVENASQEELKKTNYPSDAMIVTYKVKNKVHFDLCRGSKVNILVMEISILKCGDIKQRKRKRKVEEDER